jgi:hypothetical protein
LVGENGTHIDGTFVSAKVRVGIRFQNLRFARSRLIRTLQAVVAGSSYYVQMDPAVFPTPEKFDPQRWIQNDHSESIVAFSKGRRMCPAAQ